MSRKAKQADLRRRMAEARSKLLQSQNPLLDDTDKEGSEKGVDNSVVAKSRKRPLSPGGGSSGILRKSKYTTTTDSAAKPNSLGALMDGYGESSSEEDDDNQNKILAVESSATTVKIATPHPNQTTKKEESKHHYNPPNDGNSLSKSISTSKPAQAKEEAPISDEVWDEFNAILEADEEANIAAIDTTTTTTTSDEKLNSTKSTEDDKDTIQHDNEKSPASHSAEVKLNDDRDTNKDDLYDNDDTNTMEQTSYEARLARLILLKSKKKKKKKKKQTFEMNEVASASTNLPSANDFYDPSLAWAEDDEQEDAKVEEQISSEMDRDEEDGTNSSKQTTSASASTISASVSMATILRSRREEARMLATRGEQVAGEGDSSEDMDTSDGNWF